MKKHSAKSSSFIHSSTETTGRSSTPSIKTSVDLYAIYNIRDTPRPSRSARFLGTMRRLPRPRSLFNLFSTTNKSDEIEGVEMKDWNAITERASQPSPARTLRSRRSFYGRESLTGSCSQRSGRDLSTHSQSLRDRIRTFTPSFRRKISRTLPIDIPSPRYQPQHTMDAERLDLASRMAYRTCPPRDYLNGDWSLDGLGLAHTSPPSTPRCERDRIFSPMNGTIFPLSDNEETPQRRHGLEINNRQADISSLLAPSSCMRNGNSLNKSPFKVVNWADKTNCDHESVEAIRDVSAGTMNSVHGRSLEDPFTDTTAGNSRADTSEHGSYQSSSALDTHPSSCSTMGSDTQSSPCGDSKQRIFTVQKIRDSSKSKDAMGTSEDHSLSKRKGNEMKAKSGECPPTDSACHLSDGIEETEYVVTRHGTAAIQWRCENGIWKQKGFRRIDGDYSEDVALHSAHRLTSEVSARDLSLKLP